MPNQNRKLSYALLAVLVALAIASPAAAKAGGGHGNGPEMEDSMPGMDDPRDARDDRGPQEHGPAHADRNRGPQFADTDRDAIRGYMADDYHAKCPPGLAKKHNGCQAPGQAKKRYQVGHVLSSKVRYKPLPDDLRGRLQPPPSGYAYVTVDKDVLLISEASRKVIDAITLLSAVGK